MFAAVGLITATGAFTTVEADRTAEVDVAGDSNALLGIESAEANEEIVDDSGDQVEISLDNSNTQAAAGQGINANGVTDFGSVLNLTNNGEDTIDVKIEVQTQDVNPESLHFYVEEGEISESIGVSNEDIVGSRLAAVSASDVNNRDNPVSTRDRFEPNSKASITDSNDNSHVVVTLDAGEQVTVGLMVDLLGQDLSDDDQVISEITIVADSDLSNEGGVETTATISS
jgi:hypothetical protein